MVSHSAVDHACVTLCALTIGTVFPVPCVTLWTVFLFLLCIHTSEQICEVFLIFFLNQSAFGWEVTKAWNVVQSVCPLATPEDSCRYNAKHCVPLQTFKMWPGALGHVFLLECNSTGSWGLMCKTFQVQAERGSEWGDEQSSLVLRWAKRDQSD